MEKYIHSAHESWENGDSFIPTENMFDSFFAKRNGENEEEELAECFRQLEQELDNKATKSLVNAYSRTEAIELLNNAAAMDNGIHVYGEEVPVIEFMMLWNEGHPDEQIRINIGWDK